MQANIGTNWAENFKYSAKNICFPADEDELRKLVLQIGSGKVLGSRHSFNDVADTSETLISTERMNKIVGIDKNQSLVWVESGVRYGTLGIYLEEQGFALHNLASLPHISVGGAIATATHGSGDSNGNLASIVKGLEIMRSNGSMVKLGPENPEFFGSVVNLGALGVVTKIALSIQPTFQVTQELFENLPMSKLEHHFEEIYQAGYSVSLFTNWLDKNINQIWIKKRVDNEKPFQKIQNFFGAKPAVSNLHPIKSNSSVNCTDQMGVPGPWYERLPHFKMDFTPSNGAELQSEFYVPRKHAFKAIKEIETLHEIIFPNLLITEIRSIAADELWLSPAYKKDIVSIHFTWKQDTEKVMQIIPKIEEKLRPFDFIPHWGKLFTISGKELQSRYPKFKDFLTLAQSMDPEGKWKNDFLNRTIYA
jgi:alditol oxidase